MDVLDDEQAINVLKKYSSSQDAFVKVLNHSRAVQAVSLRISREVIRSGHDVDIGFVRSASLLHDIGRFKTGKTGKDIIMHGVYGAKMLRKEGLDERYALVCERHIGAGIDEVDIELERLKLEKKSYMPESIEEKIICYADNLIFGDKEVGYEKVVERFRKEISERACQKFIDLHNEIMALCKKQRVDII